MQNTLAVEVTRFIRFLDDSSRPGNAGHLIPGQTTTDYCGHANRFVATALRYPRWVRALSWPVNDRFGKHPTLHGYRSRSTKTHHENHADEPGRGPEV